MLKQQLALKISYWLAAACCWLSLTSQATEAQPANVSKQSELALEQIVVDANRQHLDINNNTLSFFGDVEISQGTLHLKADKLIIIRNKDDDSKLLHAFGDPVVFEHTIDDGKQVTAEAKEIKFQVNTRLLTLVGNAKIKQSDSLVSGDKIEYDVKAQKLIASSSDNTSNRVRTVLNPGK